MRYLRLFSLHFQEVLESRSRLLVWFLVVAISPLILLLFWRGARSFVDWTSTEITSYYLLIIVISSLLMSHHEDKIAVLDIQEGGLSSYLLKPFSYFWSKFFEEIPSRVIQGTFGIGLLSILIVLFPQLFVFTHSVEIFILSILISIGALFLSFLFKTIVGMIAFWTTDAKGVFETIEVILLIFSGVIMPLAFLPDWLEKVSYMLPFSYMIYFPIIAFEGKLTTLQLVQVLGVQLVWLTIFYLLYRKLWKEGIKQYTAVGQ